MPPQQHIFWAETDINAPHPAALPNLRRISKYMSAEGLTSERRVISIRALSAILSMPYPQVRGLLNRPGFVRTRKGYFYLPHFGAEYPQVLPHGDILKEIGAAAPVVSASETKPVVTATVEGNRVTITVDSPKEGTTTQEQIRGLFTSMADAVINKERTPAQIASVAYNIAQSIESGSLTIRRGEQ